MQDWSSGEPGPFAADESIAPPEPNRIISRIVTEVGEQRNRIIANWALRVATLPAFRAMPDLALEDVQRHIPEVLDGALAAISISDPLLDPAPLQQAEDLAAVHGRERLRDDFGVGDLLEEFHALRREIGAAIQRVAGDGPSDAVGHERELQQRLCETFDAIEVAAANAWMEARGTR